MEEQAAVRPLLTPLQAAAILGLPRAAVYRLTYKRRLPCLRVGKLVRFDPEVVEQLARELPPPPAAVPATAEEFARLAIEAGITADAIRDAMGALRREEQARKAAELAADGLVRFDHAALRLGLSVLSLVRLWRRGEIPGAGTSPNGLPRFAEADLIAWGSANGWPRRYTPPAGWSASQVAAFLGCPTGRVAAHGGPPLLMLVGRDEERGRNVFAPDSARTLKLMASWLGALPARERAALEEAGLQATADPPPPAPPPPPPAERPAGENLWSVEDVAAWLRVPVGWLRCHLLDLPDRYELSPAVIRFSPSRLEAWLASPPEPRQRRRWWRW